MKQAERVRSIGGNALNGASHISPVFPSGRVCSHHDCGTQLSIYNDGYYCSLHLPREVMTTRGRKAGWSFTSARDPRDSENVA